MKKSIQLKDLTIFIAFIFINIGYSSQQVILEGLRNSTFSVGESFAYLVVSIDPSVTEEGVWRKDGLVLSTVGRLFIGYNPGIQSLSISGVQTSDAGQYTFSISGESTGAYLTVTGSSPVNGAWSTWEQWDDSGTCPATCGTSATKYRTRNRLCNNPTPQNGGQTCPGSSSDTQTFFCGQESCPGPTWGEWSPWSTSACSVTCGSGERTRSRVRTCQGGSSCQGNNTENQTSSCLLKDCPVAVNGGVSEWTAWVNRSCSASCGPASRSVTRSRTCTNPMPSNGGRHCIEHLQESLVKGCQLQNCPGDSGSFHGLFKSQDKLLVAAVGAAVAVGIVLLILILVCCICLCRKNTNKPTEDDERGSWEMDQRNGSDYVIRAKINGQNLNGSGYK